MTSGVPTTDSELIVISSPNLDRFGAELERLGARVTRVVGDETSPFRNVERWISDVICREYDDVIFASAHGVRFAYEYAAQLGAQTKFVKGLRSSRLIAGGPRAAAALAEVGLRPDITCKSLDASAFRNLLATADVHGHVVSIQTSSEKDVEGVRALLESAGARVVLLTSTIARNDACPAALPTILEREAPTIVFGAPNQVRSLLHAAEAERLQGELDAALRRATLVCAQPAAVLLRQRGLLPIVVPQSLLTESRAAEFLRAVHRQRTSAVTRRETGSTDSVQKPRTAETPQDANAPFVASLQPSDVYSVVPRIAANEVTPEKLLRLGTVAQKYGLHARITGPGIDLLGARFADLPEIWEELIRAGFENEPSEDDAVQTPPSFRSRRRGRRTDG